MPKLMKWSPLKNPTGGAGSGGGGDDPAPLKDPFPMDGDQVTPKKRRAKSKKKKSKTRPTRKSGLTRKQLQHKYFTYAGVFDKKTKVIDLTPEKKKEIMALIKEEEGEEEDDTATLLDYFNFKSEEK